ncbi:MAG: hypothetical protein IJF55_03595, partial [Clostridia bacterium]|nr:hypothetical protein [Clostridia bacterium]
PLLPRRRLFVYHPSQKENEVCSLILFSITDNPHPLRRAMSLTEPSPGEKGDRSASIGVTILIINLAVAVDEEIHIGWCTILFGVNIT